MAVFFPFDEAVYIRLILDFGDIVNITDFETYLTEPVIAEQILDGIHANISSDIYSLIEIPDMRAESPGRRILRIIFDRLLT